MDLSSTTVVVVLMVEISHGKGFAKPCERERRRRWRGSPRQGWHDTRVEVEEGCG